MRQIAPLVILLLSIGCTKKDIQAFKNKHNKSQCEVVSVNADKQNSDDYFVIKTFNQQGMLIHIKAQIRDVHNVTSRFDYDITYTGNKAIFKGSRKLYDWIPDTPPDPNVPWDPYAPSHPEEMTDGRDTLDFEILTDKKTSNPVEVRHTQSGQSLLKVFYDAKGYLSRVETGSTTYYATTDDRGNILSLLTPPLVEEYYYYGPQQLGVHYIYNNQDVAKGANHYYEAPAIYISPMYSLLEILGWGPFQPNRERTAVTIQIGYVEEYVPDPTLWMSYHDHQYDQKGNLVGYRFEGDVCAYYQEFCGHRQYSRSISWQCDENTGKERKK